MADVTTADPGVKTFIGVQKRDLVKSVRKLVPDYMPMGSAGMADMGAMEMPMPDNTLPMMTGFGPFGPLEMGGMFSVMKVREGLARDDYKDPGWYQHPQGTVAYELEGSAPDSDTNITPGRPDSMRPARTRSAAARAPFSASAAGVSCRVQKAKTRAREAAAHGLPIMSSSKRTPEK